jgi:hypothetical protein
MKDVLAFMAMRRTKTRSPLTPQSTPVVGINAEQDRRSHVRYGSKADLALALRYVRFVGQSGHPLQCSQMSANDPKRTLRLIIQM